MQHLTRDQILQASDIKTEVVDVPEWGGAVTVRGLTGRQRDDFEQQLTEQKNGKSRINMQNARARMVQISVVEPDTGALLFTREDVAALGTKSAAALQRVFDVASRLSGLSDSDMEELVKN